MKEKTKILLVEDDVNLGFLLVDYLESNGFDVKLYRDGESGLKAFKNGRFDFCILDVMLPKMDGFSLAAAIKESKKRTPILMLTARSLKEDKIKGFKLGIDDYVTKPFDEEELMYRIQAILARIQETETEAVQQTDEIQIGEFTLVYQNQLLKRDGDSQRLTNKENEILYLLAASKNSLVKRDFIMEKVWGKTDYFIGRSLDVFISKIRKYLSTDASLKIDVVPTVGIILVEEDIEKV